MPNPLRAPARHGEMLVDPSGSLTELVRANETLLAQEKLRGRSLAAIREEARAEVLSLAKRWTDGLVGTPERAPSNVAFGSAKERSFAERKATNEPGNSLHWIIGGHQPELFHPGVWVKNAVVSGLASQLNGVGLNLTVDNDLCTGATVRVPSGPDLPGMTNLDWDLPRTPSPWEERPAPDAERFASFGERCQTHLRSFGIEPLAASQDWGASPERPLVDRLVQLRSSFERSVGIQNLELKVSDLADSKCFREFLLGSLREAAALREAYNSSLSAYREANHIRSHSHPVPALDETAQGIEVPFWVWRTGEAQRCRLFVQAAKTGALQLHDGTRTIGEISLDSETTGVRQLADLRQQGWKIRPRALMLTLFCRTHLASTFVHGIGGAKYDEMTDVLMQRWLGLTPPAIIVATATERLFERFAGPRLEPEIARLQHELRQIRWNPESVDPRYSEKATARALRAEKSQLLTSSASSAARHARIQEINSQLRSPLTLHEQAHRAELRQLLDALPHQQSLRSREFAANLFPAEALRDLFQRAMEHISER